jgi:hypothetical protein
MILPVATEEPGEITFGLHLTGPELKVTYTALHALRDGLGHEEADVARVVQSVLDKLPDEHAIRAIQLPRRH